jgi:hypothetical protein
MSAKAKSKAVITDADRLEKLATWSTFIGSAVSATVLFLACGYGFSEYIRPKMALASAQDAMSKSTQEFATKTKERSEKSNADLEKMKTVFPRQK